MKMKRTILFRAGAILALLIIAAVMMRIGRGHTIYLDNKKIEYNGQTYESLYKVVVTVDGEQIAKLRDKERGMATNIGQNFKMSLEVTPEKGAEELVYNVTLSLPYSMDGIAINLPAYLAGAPQEAYLSEFVVTEETEEETTASDEAGADLLSDEFGLDSAQP